MSLYGRQSDMHSWSLHCSRWTRQYLAETSACISVNHYRENDSAYRAAAQCKIGESFCYCSKTLYRFVIAKLLLGLTLHRVRKFREYRLTDVGKCALSKKTNENVRKTHLYGTPDISRVTKAIYRK